MELLFFRLAAQVLLPQMPHLGCVVQSSFRGTSLFFRPNAVCSKVVGFVATLRIFLVL